MDLEKKHPEIASDNGEIKAPTTASEESGSIVKADVSDEMLTVDKSVERSIKLKLDFR